MKASIFVYLCSVLIFSLSGCHAGQLVSKGKYSLDYARECTKLITQYIDPLDAKLVENAKKCVIFLIRTGEFDQAKAGYDNLPIEIDFSFEIAENLSHIFRDDPYFQIESAKYLLQFANLNGIRLTDLDIVISLVSSFPFYKTYDYTLIIQNELMELIYANGQTEAERKHIVKTFLKFIPIEDDHGYGNLVNNFVERIGYVPDDSFTERETNPDEVPIGDSISDLKSEPLFEEYDTIFNSDKKNN